ncbi:MAG TPA: amidase family protein, partial [Planctomycetaceae bacterium]|nr:amidase family protein [Planctomycetaceae bacterium]
MSIIGATAGELLQRFERGDVSCVEATTAYLDTISVNDASIKAFLHVDWDHAIAQARAVDEKRQRHEPLGKLAGLPVAVKDVVCTQGQATTCASRMLKGFVPPYDAHVVA